MAVDDPDRAALHERVRCTCVVQQGVGAGAEDVQGGVQEVAGQGSPSSCPRTVASEVRLPAVPLEGGHPE